METKRFDPSKLERLNNPERLKAIPPDRIREMAGLTDPKTLIDLGAGTGFFSIPFAEAYPECTIHACDISDVMVGWMEEHLVPRYPTIRPLKMEDSRIPLPDVCADFLFMINLHHELDRPDQTLAECRRLLKPGGKIAISDWKKVSTNQGPSLEIRVDVEDVEQQLLDAGFSGIRSHNDLPTNFIVVAER
ncbi:MAG: methyltransferase domain-containing protein [Bacteroidales bacterium]